MTFQIIASGRGNQSLLVKIVDELRFIKPRAVGVATAYLSMFGMTELLRAARFAGCRRGHLVAGIDGEVTHPTALKMALEAGWIVRIGDPGDGIFHPKLIICGKRFDLNGKINAPSCLYVGSGNMTRGGLIANVECGMWNIRRRGRPK